MRKPIIALIFCLVSLVISACFRSTVDLNGSVFIVTNGGENVRLGLVKVTAIPESQISKFLSDKKIAISAETSKLVAEAEALKPKVDELQRVFDENKKKADSIEAQLNALKSKESSINLQHNPYLSDYLSEYDTPEMVEERTKQAQLGKQLDSIRKQISGFSASSSKAQSIASESERQLNQVKERQKEFSDKVMTYLTSAYLLDGLPEGSIKTVTDADGKFSLSLPKGKYALFATAQRRIISVTEDYNWLVWVDGSNPTQISLTNQNSLLQDSEDAVFKIGDLVPSLGKPNTEKKTTSFGV